MNFWTSELTQIWILCAGEIATWYEHDHFFVYWFSDFFKRIGFPASQKTLSEVFFKPHHAIVDHFSGLKRLHLFDETLVDGHWNNVTNVWCSVFWMCSYQRDWRGSRIPCYMFQNHQNFYSSQYIRNSRHNLSILVIFHPLWQGHQETYLTPEPRPWGQTIRKDFKNES